METGEIMNARIKYWLYLLIQYKFCLSCRIHFHEYLAIPMHFNVLRN